MIQRIIRKAGLLMRVFGTGILLMSWMKGFTVLLTGDMVNEAFPTILGTDEIRGGGLREIDWELTWDMIGACARRYVEGRL